ncbi:MAG: glycosyl hydrolase family 28 protein [Bacilli bacterium]|jgi:hypothetical protein|nr:glycosyl hydrolase family 28 protein [Bacilli bacterium]
MQKNKRLISILAIALLALTGCGNSNNSSSVDASSIANSQSDSSSSASSSLAPGAYYNKDNFIPSEQTVSKTSLVTYQGPSMMSTSPKAQIKVNNEDLFVYETRVNFARSFTYDYSSDTAPVSYFDFQGKVHVQITVPSEVTSALVRPLVYGIVPTITNKTIEFDLENPADYTIEYNDDYKTAIHLFANPLEEDPITEEEAKADSKIIYFGPGVYKADAIPMDSGDTLYLAGGAYVFGQVITDGLENLTIRGRGILDGAIYERKTASEKQIPLQFTRTKNINISGISILDPAGWAVAMIDSSQIRINDLRIISARANGDGISLQSCSDVIVNRGFVRTWDDSLVVKNVNRGSTSDITFDGTEVWTDLAQSMEVGYETNGPTMDGITFKNITVLHNFHKACISTHNCDDAHITNVNFENITLEDGEMLGDVQTDGENDFFIDFTIAYNAEWTKSGGKRGKIDGVNVKNVKVYHLADTIVSRMQGEDADSSIDNVTIENLEIEGKKITSKEAMKLTTNDYVTNLKVQASDQVCGAKIALKYNYQSDGSQPTVITNKTRTQEGIEVPAAYQLKDALSYIGEKADVSSSTVTVTHGVGATTKASYDDGKGSFAQDGFPASNLIDNDRSTFFESKDYTQEEDEFIAVTVEFNKLVNVGVVRLFGAYDNDFFTRYSISVFGRKLKSDGTPNPLFVRVLSSADYQITPAFGNAADISFTPVDFLALQLRFFRKSGLGYQTTIKLGDLAFYPPSLTYNKPIVDSTPHNDVYDVSKINDGQTSGTSYYESATLPAFVIIDMKDLYKLKFVVMFLPGLMSWSARTENIEILTSDSQNEYSSTSTVFKDLVAPHDYTFDPAQGNMIVLDVSSLNVSARFIKLVITSNSAEGGYGAQLSELTVYGEK